MNGNNTLKTTKYEGVYSKELKNLYQGKPDISYYIVYRTNGDQIKKTVGKRSQRMTPAKAYQIKNDILYEIRHGISDHNEKDVLFKSIVDMWYKDKKDKLKSITQDRQRLDNYASALFTKKVKDINAKDIKKIYDHMMKVNLSEQTFKKTYSMIKRVINHAVENDYIKRAPIIKLNLSIKDKKTTEIYSNEMINRYLNVIQNYEDKTFSQIVKFIFCTGMRRTESLKMKWSDYSYENSTVKISDAKSGQDEIYYLSNTAKELIELQRGKTKTFIFEKEPGELINPSRLTYHAAKMKERAVLPNHYRPLHSLRHHFGTLLARNGLNAFKIQKMMTHKDIKTTQRYIDLADSEIVNDLNMIEQNITIN